ncbi:M4 family metallopeptidase [Streptomyces orinoci]|uniref:M4 family metallopeptidase n=1 Tax=Streptomyces orinoci TaxID=67339 RepID=A0ABV3JT57_STRON|nr:M4 family metallopeptidase [Streptomyces orinoci]
MVSGAPALAAARTPAPSPVEVIPGQGTATPALVTGIREAVTAKAGPADAARAHLARQEGRYRIADPDHNLTPVRTLRQDGTETVRLQQRYRGVEVLGGQYVVRMENKDGKRVVTGTSGRYFTGLRTAVRAQVGEQTAVRRAVAAVAGQLGGRTLGPKDVPPRPGRPTPAAAALSGTARGLVVLPRGSGVLTQHITVHGRNPVTGEPVLREVYIDARAGFPVLQYSGIQTFAGPAAPGTATARNARQDTRRATGDPVTTGSGVKYDGQTVELGVELDPARKEYLLRDRRRMADTSKNVIATWDARGKDVAEANGKWPAGIREFGSPTPEFGKDATESGAVDAHWAAAQVYDYYRSVHKRDSLDGQGMTINSLVGVTDFGGSYVNAFWDGTKMVYGGGDKEYRTLSAGLDVVGHEMTHGVVENSAGLVYAGQSGALNEALADYFGAAIRTNTYGIAMDDPDAGLLGGSLCRTKSPRQCAFRDLGDGRTTSKSFLGVSFATDNGGVHLNSTIFSGALWDMRKDLGPTLADKIVYRALTRYMTPLDGFTEGRNAVLAAARELKISARALRAVERDFNAHGIVPNWELALGVDSDRLLDKVNTNDSTVGAGGGYWAAAKSNDDGSEPYSVWAGHSDGTGATRLLSPNDGRYHVDPATDGKTVAWAAYGPDGVDVLSRPLSGGPVRKLYSTTGTVTHVRVSDIAVVFEVADPFGGRHVGYVRTGEKKAAFVDDARPEQSTSLPSVSGYRIAYARAYPEGDSYRYGTEVLDLRSGTRTLMSQLGTPAEIGQTGINHQNVFWLVPDGQGQGRTVVRRAALDGTAPVDFARDKAAEAGYAFDLTVSESAVTVNSQVPDQGYHNETMAKLWQFTTDGAPRGRMSCNRGEQLSGVAVSGRQVVWLDGTTGWTDLVTRTRPAGNCG